MSTVVIKVDGTDITDDVMIRNASFSSQVNGAVGQATFQVKDLVRAYDFNSGDELSLDIDGDRVWTGYIFQAKKKYALSVVDTDILPRVWEVVGLDLNVLFSKRIVFKESDPTGKLDFSYDASTYDDTIINDIFDNYVELDDDDLTRDGVTRIAHAILDVPGRTHTGLIASAGYTWKQMMDSVQRATGGVYYISPDRDLAYVDAETVTSPYALTDTPTGSDVGYQSISIFSDGSNLVNDMFVWGAGEGSKSYVFSRTQDSDSIDDHNRWQLGLVTGGLFRQASADIVADSYVYGTPQSHRGGKDDAVAFNVRVFQPVYRAGDIVDLTCQIFDYSDALPLRRMTTTFVSPTEPIFDLVLSHAIDQPVSIFEYLIGKFPIDRIPPIKVDPPDPLPPDPHCTDEQCGITDTFQREETGGLGTSDAGIDWGDYSTSDPGWSVAAGVATGDSSLVPFNFMFARLEPTVTRSLRVNGQMTATDPDDSWYFGADSGPDTDHEFFEVDFYQDGRLEVFTNTGDDFVTMPFTPDQPFKVRVDAGGANAQVKVWLASDPEPSGWTVETAFDTPITVFDWDIYIGAVSNTNTAVVKFSQLDAVGVNRCSAGGGMVDDFTRTEASDWNDSSNQGTWDTTIPGDVSFSVDPIQGGIINLATAYPSNPVALLPVDLSPPFGGGTLDVYTDVFIQACVTGERTTFTFFLTRGDDTSTQMNATVIVDDANPTELECGYQNSNGDGGGSGATVNPGTVQGYWNRFHMQLSATGVRAAIWPRGAAEPAFQQVSDADFVGQLLADFSGATLLFGYTIPHQTGRSVPGTLIDYFVKVKNVTITYTGQPCYPCAGAVGLLTEDNYATDWFIEDEEGDYSIVGDKLVVHVDAAGSASAAHIFRFVDVPRANVLAGITLDVDWDLTFGAQPADGEVSLGARFQIQSSSSSRRIAEVHQDIVKNSSDNHWVFQPSLVTIPSHTLVADDVASGAPNNFRMAISPTGGYSDWLDQGLSDATYGTTTIPAGDPLTIRLELEIVLAAGASTDITGRIGTPIIRDLVSGNVITIPGQTGCDGDCVDSIIHDEFGRTTSPGWQGPVAASFAPGNLFPSWAATDAACFTNGSAGVISLSMPLIPVRSTTLVYGVSMKTMDMLIVGTCDRNLGGSDFIQVFTGLAAPDVVIGPGTIGIQGIGGATDSGVYSFDLSDGFRIRIDADAYGNATAAIWKDGDPEPPAIVTIPSDPGERYDRVDIRASISFGSPDLDVIIDDFYVEGQSCASVAEPVPGPTQTPSSGKTCETITHHGGQDFQASRAFFTGSLEVFVNGLAKTGFTTVGTAGTFHLAASIDPTDWLHVCYRANGDYI